MQRGRSPAGTVAVHGSGHLTPGRHDRQHSTMTPTPGVHDVTSQVLKLTRRLFSPWAARALRHGMALSMPTFFHQDPPDSRVATEAPQRPWTVRRLSRHRAISRFPPTPAAISFKTSRSMGRTAGLDVIALDQIGRVSRAWRDWLQPSDPLPRTGESGSPSPRRKAPEEKVPAGDEGYRLDGSVRSPLALCSKARILQQITTGRLDQIIDIGLLKDADRSPADLVFHNGRGKQRRVRVQVKRMGPWIDAAKTQVTSSHNPARPRWGSLPASGNGAGGGAPPRKRYRRR